MIDVRQDRNFSRSRGQLKDRRVRALLASRLDRLAFGQAGGALAVGDDISEFAIDLLPDGRLYVLDRKTTWVALLLCLDDRRRTDDLGSARWLAQGSAEHALEELPLYDPTEDLPTDETAALFMAQAFSTGDDTYIAHAFGIVARAQGITRIAEKAGLSREELYRAFGGSGGPTVKTTLALMQALGGAPSTKPAS